MKYLPKPTFTPEEVFSTCISNISSVDLKTRLSSIIPVIDIESNRYDMLATAKTLEVIYPHSHVNHVVTAEESKKVYTEKMAKKGAPGRFYYDQIKAIPKHGICPLCGVRIVSTLDHHLPKAHYPVYSVVPYNLVPACSDCNKIKSDAILTNATDQTLHPYYDNIENIPWLRASVIEEIPPSILFHATPPDDCPPTIAARIIYHFHTLQLSFLYGSYAANELENIAYSIKEIYRVEYSDGVREHLRRQSRSYSHQNINSWQSAMYHALFNSDWYCNVSFQS